MNYRDDFITELVGFYKNLLGSIRQIKLSKNNQHITHQPIVPFATYCPWHDDRWFMDLFHSIQGNTLVDIYRCYELYNLLVSNLHVSGDILEVGVWKGGTGCLLAKTLNRVSPSSKTFLVDTFSGVVKAGNMDTQYKGGEHSDTTEEMVQALLTSMAIQNVQLLKGIYPDEVLINPENGLRLCHIDVDTYQSAKETMLAVWPLLNKGGVAVFDDYGFWGCEGVTKFCNELQLKGGIFLYNLNGHALFIKTG